MENKVECKSRFCDNKILPKTADHTGGLCMPCYKQRYGDKAFGKLLGNSNEQNYLKGFLCDSYPGEYKEYVDKLKLHRPAGKHDTFLPETDDQLDACFRNASDVAIEKAYGKAIKYALNWSMSERTVSALAILSDKDLSEYINIVNDVFHSSDTLSRGWRSEIYRNASLDITRKLVNKIESETCLFTALQALAWTGSELAVQKFLEWKRERPDWAVGTICLVSELTKDAGWELDDDGSKRSLYWDVCYPVVEANSENKKCISMRPRSGNCPWCEGRTFNLFDLSTKDKRLSHLPNICEKIVIPVCLCCVQSGTIYSISDESGKWFLDRFQEREPYDECIKVRIVKFDNEMIVPPLVLSENRRMPLLGSVASVPVSRSQIGGMPTYKDFPKCIYCERTMKAIGQLQLSRVNNSPIGTHIGYLCDSCFATAVQYIFSEQQIKSYKISCPWPADGI